MATLKETPSQTAGPYLHIGCVPSVAGLPALSGGDLGGALPSDTRGTRIRVEGLIRDGEGAIVHDAMIELWQTDGDARAYIWMRQATDLDTGFYTFDTVMPASMTASAPYLCLWIVARGINLGLHTRVYFPGEAANKTDPLIARAGTRRDTLIASRPDAEEDERDTGMPVYRFDINLQGERETVFLDV